MKEARERYYKAMRLYRNYRVVGPDGIDMILALDENGVREFRKRGWLVNPLPAMIHFGAPGSF